MNKQRFTIYGNADDLDGIQKAIDLVKENEKLQNRINKAIEYIREYRNGWNNWFEFTIEDKLNLLNILKGSDKE